MLCGVVKAVVWERVRPRDSVGRVYLTMVVEGLSVFSGALCFGLWTLEVLRYIYL